MLLDMDLFALAKKYHIQYIYIPIIGQLIMRSRCLSSQAFSLKSRLFLLNNFIRDSLQQNIHKEFYQSKFATSREIDEVVEPSKMQMREKCLCAALYS